MFFRLIALLPVLWVVPALPDLIVKWNGADHNTLSVQVNTHSEILDRCLDSGIEIQYRFEMQACKRREGWFHYCREKRVVIQSLQFDPISQSYKLDRDRLGDGSPAVEANINQRAEALSLVSQIPDLPVEYLTRGDMDLAQSDRTYLSVRALADCRSEYSDALMHLGYFVTLGLVRVAAYNSGWLDFTLTEPKTQNNG